jgi:hypothetical protein
LWFDASNDNELFQWDGSAWQPFQYGTDAISVGSVTAALIAAGTIVAGIVNGTTITGAQIVADGTSGDFLVYSGTPAAGNLVASISPTSGTDGFGNPYTGPGLGIYGISGNTFKIFLGSQGNIPILRFFTNAAFEQASANIASGTVGASATLQMEALFSGPQGSTTGAKDWAQLQLFSNNQGGSANAGLALNYIDTTGAVKRYLQLTNAGILLPSCALTAVQPGTGTSPSNPATSAAWTNLSLVNSYSAGSNNGFIDVPQVRLLADNQMLQFKGTLTTPASPSSTVFAQLPANFPNANLGGPFGVGVIMNGSGGTGEHVNIHNNGNVSLNNIHSSFNFDLSCIVPTQ